MESTTVFASIRGGGLDSNAREKMPLVMRTKELEGMSERLQLVGDERQDYQHTSILDLPPELLGRVLDFLLGHMSAAISTQISVTPQASKSVASVMRHPRRKALSDIALISRAWRKPVQERIYRHIKIKGTRSGLADSREWFLTHGHLTSYVRHIEVWIPVWGDRTAVVARPIEEEQVLQQMDIARQYDGSMILSRAPDVVAGTLAFKPSTYNATLSDIFQHVGCFFPGAKIFTLEGGHCKKSRLVQVFASQAENHTRLETLPQVRTFVMKGSWNLMRDHTRWHLFEKALPNVQEWHCGYARPQFEGYATVNDILSNYSLSSVRHLNINLEGWFGKDNTLNSSHPAHRAPFHLCHQLGKIAPQLESITFGGKICSGFFLAAWTATSKSGVVSNLTSVDIGVKNCCRPRPTSEEDTGDSVVGETASITSNSFIKAFDNMVTVAVFSLNSFPAMKYLRIRFIDLDSACPLLNPYFQLIDGKCTGLWNEEILDILSQFHPGVYYEELNDGIYSQPRKGEASLAAVYPRTRPRSIKTSSYKLLTDTRV